MPLTTNDALLEAWAEQIETMEQNLETLYGPSGITPTLPDVTTEDGMLEAIADEAGKSAWKFAKLYNATVVEAGTTKTVTVPSTALYCGEFVKIGGAIERSDGDLLMGAVTQVISKDGAGNVIDVYDVPAEVIALTGYGWSTGTIYNYIDFERKVFVQNVGKAAVTSADVPAADSGYVVSGTFTSGIYNGRTYTFIRNFKYAEGGAFADRRVGGYSAVTPITTDTILNNTSFSNSQFRTYFIDIADRDTLLAKIGNGVDMYYELAAPVETDISAYLTDDIIKVVPGGTLTFVNEPDLDVPSEVEYIGI